MPKTGRPSAYEPTFCERVIALGKEGMSPAEIASDLGVARSTMLGWAAKHDAFADALDQAHNEAQAWWERKGREGLDATRFQATLWKKIMEARFREDYTEKREVAVTGTVAINLIDHFDGTDPE
ncbi:MAG: helix-turn-helix domain-containing protein [Pseudomonadota bacterium]